MATAKKNVAIEPQDFLLEIGTEELPAGDLDAALEQLKAHQIRLINPEPVKGSDGKRVAFIHPQSTQGVLVELCETKK